MRAEHRVNLPLCPNMINLHLTQEDVAALANLMDMAVKSAGLVSVKDAARILEKLEIAAKKETLQPAETP